MGSTFKENRNKIRIVNRNLYVVNNTKRIRRGTCHVIHRYGKSNNKYMKNYNKNKKSSYIQYLDANDLYQ